MYGPQSLLFTPAEAAVLTRLSVKSVNNAIDKKTVAAVSGRRAGYATRLLDFCALIALALERRLADRFAPELRRAAFRALTSTKRCDMVSLDGGFLKIDLREPRRELAGALKELRQARRMANIDPDIYGGDPVFRGTRVPIHLVAEMQAKGDGIDDILAGYPQLTAGMVRLALIYAAAYPLRGRPRRKLGRDTPPAYASQRKLVTIPVK